jgi:acetyl-CoA C-acetyltransferase
MARATLMARKCNDCFSISEIVQYEILGFAERGEGAQLIESGATSLPSGRLPVNAGGGLIGDGHPVGATDVRQVAEAFTQLTGKAGAPDRRRKAFSYLQHRRQRQDEC